ncbi:HNH endonuclease signature motif containing protein [Microbacterium sp. 18062]|uniref:HNH endonuclease n=1 Tax=Microbacterium sp. 18062 TaxID=2681410 RepID=UPI00135A70CA|nr:HNH endonuclease signature motif containing protein [Microbacterium sp. 18062]
MSSKVPAGHSDADYAERASIVAAVVSAERAVAVAQAAAVHAYAKAAAHAERLTASRPARDRDMATRALAAEIGCAGRLSDRTVQHRMNDAHATVTTYPETMAALAEGHISQNHVRAITDAGLPLDADDRVLFDQAAVHICATETSGRAKRLLDLLAEELNPRTLTERHRDARETRAVRVLPLPDGMAELTVILPVVLAHAILDRLTQQGRAVKNIRERARADVAERTPDAKKDGTAYEGDASEDAGAGAAGASAGACDEGVTVAGATGEIDAPNECAAELSQAEIIASDERTLDQIRADILADLLLTGAPDTDPSVTGDGPGELGAIRAVVQITVPVLALAGESEDPADLAGRSPIDADTARRLAGGCTGWDRILTHPITGAVLSVDRYRPTDAMRRMLRARDQHCRFPGCRMPAVRCDADHTIDHADGGETCVSNLCHLCRRHHVLKHGTPWTVRQRSGGVLEWTSPLGHVYIDTPPQVGPTRVRFVPDGGPPPSDPPPF